MDLAGRLIDGKYQLVSLAGEGGMALVYKAVVRGAAGFQRTVAVKHIKPEYRALKNYIDMFIEEARVGSELAHPNIVQVHDFCSEAGSYYLIMEWVEGIDLGALIKVNRDAVRDVPWPVAAIIAIGTLRGLGAAHDRVAPDGTPAPVIHRDVSPHNVLLGLNGAVKLSDFGLARARDRAASLTAPGTVKGKLSYLAPEVTFGKPKRASVCECERTPDENLAQALHTLNGDVLATKIVDGKGRIAALLAAKKPHDEIVTEIYLATVSRRPTPAEAEASHTFLAASPSPPEYYQDLIWALINSKQFLFVR